MKKVPIILCISLVLGVCASVQAQSWDDGEPADHNWSSPLNWDTDAIPVNGGWVDIIGVPSAPPNNPVVQVGDLVPASGFLEHVVVGGSGSPAGVDAKLVINGGQLELSQLSIAWDSPAGTVSTVEMTDGILDITNIGGGAAGHFGIGVKSSVDGGSAVFTQSGGTVTCLVGVLCWNGSPSATLNLLGGEFNIINSLQLHIWPSGQINIDGGTLIVEGDMTTSVANWVTAGNIIAADGAGLVVYDYNVTHPGKTTVTAAAGPTVAYWRFEGGVDGVEHAGDQDDWYTDLSGNGNHLSSWWDQARPMATSDRPFDPVPLTGEANDLSVYFDHSDDLGTFGGRKMLNYASFDNGWTVEATFKLEKRWDWQGIVGKDGKPNSGAPYQAFCFKTFPDGTLIVDYTDNNLDRHEIATTAGFLDLNTWYSVAATYDAATKTARLYVKAEGETDYTEIGAWTDAYGVSFRQENQTWLVGRAMWDGSPGNFVDGEIDEVRISCVTLDPSEFLNASQTPDGNGIADAWEIENLGAADGDTSIDSDDDGISDLLEYAFGGDPNVDDAAAISPAAGAYVGGNLGYVFNRRLDGTGIYEMVIRLSLDDSIDSNWYPISMWAQDWETGTGSFNAEAEAVTNQIPIVPLLSGPEPNFNLPQAFCTVQYTGNAYNPMVFGVPGSPSPANGNDNATDDGALSWTAVAGAVEYKVYMGTDEAAVANGTAASYTVAGTNYDASALLDTLGVNYFWRVEPVGAPGTVFTSSPVWNFTPTIPAELGRGHQLFVKHGIQSSSVVFVGDFGFDWATGNPLTNVTWATYQDANFNSVNTHGGWLDLLTDATGPANMTYTRWCEGQTELSTGSGNGTVSDPELAYMGGTENLVALQAADEENLNDSGWRNAIKNAFDRWKVAYPDTLVYTTQNGPSNDGGIDAFQKFAKPDMSFMFTYEFKGGGNIEQMWKSCRDFRQYGRNGIGTSNGDEPIPYGMYYQSMNLTDRHISLPEICLGMFGPITYGYKYISGFVYSRNANIAPENDIRTELFTSNNDSTPSLLYYEAQENNRQILLMSDTLCRLYSEAVYDINVTGYATAWSSGAVPGLTAISASPVGSKASGTDKVLIGHFRPLSEKFDGPGYSGQEYFMIMNADYYNGVTLDGYPADYAQDITLTVNSDLESIDLATGAKETLTRSGGTVTITLDGGRAKLFKFATGAPFIGID